MEPFDDELRQAFRRSMGAPVEPGTAYDGVRARARRARRRRAVARAATGTGAVVLLVAGALVLARPGNEDVTVATSPLNTVPVTTPPTAATTVTTTPATTAPTTAPATVPATAAPTTAPTTVTAAPATTAPPAATTATLPPPPATAAPSASAGGACGRATATLVGGVLRVTPSPAAGCTVHDVEEGPTEAEVELRGEDVETTIRFRLVDGRIVPSVEEHGRDSGGEDD